MCCLYSTLHTAVGLTVVTVTNSIGTQSAGEVRKDLEHKRTCISTGKQYCHSLEKRAWQTQVGKQHQMGLHRAASHGLRPGWWPVKQRKGNIIMISMGKEQPSFMAGQFTGLLMTQSKGYQTLQEMIPNFPLCQLSNENRAEWRLWFYAYGVTQVLASQLWSQHPLCDDHFPCRNEINPILLSIHNEEFGLPSKAEGKLMC